MDKYMLVQNLRARGVIEDDIKDVLRYGDMVVRTKRGTSLDVIRRGNWYYFL